MLVEQVRKLFWLSLHFHFKKSFQSANSTIYYTFKGFSLNIQFPDVFKLLYKINPLIWSHSWCINHAHNGQRKLVKTLKPELFSLYRFESVKQKILLYCFPSREASDLPLFFFPVTIAVCHLSSIPKEVTVSGPLLWVTGTVRAVFQFSLGFPSPPLTRPGST